MKKMITLIALIAVLALMSTGCSELNSPTGPAAISAIDFPAEGNGGGEQAARPAAPTNLRAETTGDTVKLVWDHTSMDLSWYRVYFAADAGGYVLIQTTTGVCWNHQPDFEWEKLKYKVTAVNAQGLESPFSDAATAYRDKGKDEPEQEIGQDDMDDFN